MNISATTVSPASARGIVVQPLQPPIGVRRVEPQADHSHASSSRGGTRAESAAAHERYVDGEREFEFVRRSGSVLGEQRRPGSAQLLAAMIEHMGGAATSIYKGMYVNTSI